MESKAIIFTEAGNKFGYGHLMRCLAIAQGFQERGIKSVFYLRGNPDAGEILKEFLWKPIDWFKEPVDVKNKIVILDSYYADKNFCKKVYKEAKAVLFIDDNNRIPYPGGFVLNSTIGTEDIDYPDNPKIIYLLGPKYHSLRREFWEVQEKVIRERVEKILITFGASDMTNETLKILKMLKEKYPDLEKHIVVGKWFSNIWEIKAEADKKTVLIYYPDAERIKQEMLKADICISGGGQTAYELARVGVPTIGICFAENQEMNLKRWKKEGILQYVGWYNDEGLIEKISFGFDSIQSYSKRKSFNKAGKGCIDGRGAERLTQVIQEKALLQNKKGNTLLKLRNVTKDDCRDIWHWRNHPEVRKVCYETEPLRYNEHQRWFSDKINNTSTDFFIVENENKQKIGQVRFEKNSKNAACINVNLNPIFFGKGLGSKIIKNATEYFMNKYSKIKVITAEILDSNIVSQKAFKKAGYKFHKHTILKNKKTSIFKFINQ